MPHSRPVRVTVFLLALAALACNAPFLPGPPSGPGRGLVAYLGSDGNVYSFDPDAPEPVALTTDAQPDPASGEDVVLYRYPAWSPDGRTLAFVSLRIGGSALLVAEPGAASPPGPREIFSSEDEAPFYLYWAPDSASVTFLTSAPSGENLLMRQAFPDGAEARVLDTGQPYYWHWSPDAAQILVHTGGSGRLNPDAAISLLQPGSGESDVLAPAPGRFQAPAWAPDGESFLAVAGADGPDELARFDRDGTLLASLLEVEGQTAFTWSPDGTRIAVHPTTAAIPLFGPLLLLDAQTGEIDWNSEDALTLAYFWSPDGTRLAFFHLESEEGLEALARPRRQDGRGLLSLSVLEVATGLVSLLSRFEPTGDFLEVVPFFDQYHHSITIWSPDSSQLVYTGVDEAGLEAVWIVPAGGGEPPKWMFEGGLAIWSWK